MNTNIVENITIPIENWVYENKKSGQFYEFKSFGMEK